MGKRWVERLAECGSVAAVQFSPARGTWRPKIHTCGLQVCPTCQATKARKYAARVAEWMGHVKRHNWRMITLTLQSSDDPLDVQLELLKKSFRRLRQQELWASTQNYGVGFIEVTLNATTLQWHPHLHVLSRGRYIDAKALSAAWQTASAGSRIVHVTEIRTAKGAACYVSKYACKAWDEEFDLSPARMPEERLREWVACFGRQRWKIRFGDGPPMPPEAKANDDGLADDWSYCGDIPTFLRGAKQGNARDRSILDACGIPWHDGPPQVSSGGGGVPPPDPPPQDARPKYTGQSSGNGY